MAITVGFEAHPGLSDGDLQTLLNDLSAASAELSRSADVPISVAHLIESLPDRLHADRGAGSIGADAFLESQAYAGASMAVRALLERDSGISRRGARLALEQVRQALRDIAEARPYDDGRPVSALIAAMEDELGLSRTKLSSLLAAAPDTVQRWKRGVQTPDETSQIRLRRLTTLLAQLSRSLTPLAAAEWLDRSHPALKGALGTPAEQLDDDEGYRVVLDLAARLRTMTAT